MRDLGAHNAMILRNHGLLTCGATRADAFDLMYYLERACQAQVAAMAGGAELDMPPARRRAQSGAPVRATGPHGARQRLGALLRMLDRIDPAYRRSRTATAFSYTLRAEPAATRGRTISGRNP